MVWLLKGSNGYVGVQTPAGTAVFTSDNAYLKSKRDLERWARGAVEVARRAA